MKKIMPKTRKFIALLIITILANASFAAASPDITTYRLVKDKTFKEIPVKVIKTITIPQWYHEGLFFDEKDIWVTNGNGGDTWVVDTLAESVTATIKPIAGFTEAITKGPGGNFYVTDWDEMKLYKAQIEDNKMLSESWISFAPAHPAGVIWNGANFFVLTWTRGVLGTRFNLLKLDSACRAVAKVAIWSFQEPAHLAWDGKNLWITSWYNRYVYKVDIEKWKILGAFHSPVERATGIAWDGKFFWLTGTKGDLYQLEVG